MSMIRFIAPSMSPRMRAFAPNMTVGDILAEFGIVQGGSALTVNGRHARPTDQLSPDSTVALQPRAHNG